MADILDDLKVWKSTSDGSGHVNISGLLGRAIFEIEHDRREVNRLTEAVTMWRNLDQQRAKSRG